uniref:Small ribosomal subunit protein uS10m n=1 Tax=Evadne anonyx TaxID=141404 RepID=A0A9N6WQM9_9CRUS|nr:EOG090X0GP9 [Evadne anonyx]
MAVTLLLTPLIPHICFKKQICVCNQDVGEPDQLFKTVQVEVRGADPTVLKSYEWFARAAASNLGITIGDCWSPKGRKDRLTLLKSVHIYKKHRVQYEIRTHFTHMNFHKLTGSTADTFLEYIQRNLPEGVAMKVTKIRLKRQAMHSNQHGEFYKKISIKIQQY